jgi:hypothetical protein
MRTLGIIVGALSVMTLTLTCCVIYLLDKVRELQKEADRCPRDTS